MLRYKMKNEYNEYLEFAKSIALYAGEVMLKYFNAKDISKFKGDKSIVTLADTEINSYLIDQVKKTFPTHSVMGEEENFGSSNYVWVCDPVDGTMPYANGLPISTFALALVIDGVSVVGVAYDPFLERLYHGVKGEGSFSNGERLCVNDVGLSDKRSLGHSVVLPKTHTINRFDLTRVNNALHEKTMLLSFYSTTRTAMAIAEGYCNFSLLPFIGKFNHDVAAVKVIVEEAGGIVRNFNGEEDRMDGNINGAIICNKVVYDEILKILKDNL